MGTACLILFIIGGLSSAIAWEGSNHSPNDREKKRSQAFYGITGICFFFLFILLGSMAGG
jgi:tryptophan-rich sensory protein